MPRILVCHECHKLERLTDPPEGIPHVPATMEWDDHGTVRSYTYEHEDGTPVMVPEHDPLLEDAVARHTHGYPDGVFVKKGIVEVYPVDQATWERLDVVTELKSELNKATGEFYEESSYYRDEALKCYNEHKNPDLKAGCRDFLSDSKRIGPKMANPKHQIYLCHVCPYMQTYLAEEMRHRHGLYDGKIKRKSRRKTRK